MIKLILYVIIASLLNGCLDHGSEIGNPLDGRDSIPKQDTIPGVEYSSFIPYSSEKK